MVARNILEMPPQFQWDTDAAPCQSSNCGPTSVAMIAGYYKDTHISPTSMRLAMTGSSACGGTNQYSSVTGLYKYGIPAKAIVLTSDQVKQTINQNIPIEIAVLYGKIPRNTAYIQDMNFTGNHSIVGCQVATVNGVSGLYIRDPDRWSTGKVNSVFWPDSVWIPAFYATSRTIVQPLAAKVLPPLYPYSAYDYEHLMSVVPADGLHVRSAPNTNGTIEQGYPQGTRVNVTIRTDRGGIYSLPTGGTSTTWVAYLLNGTYHWMAAGYLSVIV